MKIMLKYPNTNQFKMLLQMTIYFSYLKKLNKLAFQPWGSQLTQHRFSYPVDFPNRCAQKLLEQKVGGPIKRERNTAKQQEDLVLAIEATDET